MILHLIQWYLLIGCVVMVIAALLQLCVDEQTIKIIMPDCSIGALVMVYILLYCIWPFVLYSTVYTVSRMI